MLHDGPPYANGRLHVGHALNKILKDVMLRVQVQQGRRVRYVPGWDCHGLPIELKALGPDGGAGLSPLQVRHAARRLAESTVADQMAAFRSYGVMADWDRRWTTMDPGFEVAQLRLFRRMVQRGLVYRRYRPVYWSPSSRTALAEAELEYDERHVSTAAYVKFRLAAAGPLGAVVKDPLFAVVWTTTPWTLPANKAIAVREDMEYMVVRVRSGEDGGGTPRTEALIIATERYEAARSLFLDELHPEVIVPSIKGVNLVGLEYLHPLEGEAPATRSILHADLVTADSGTGLVHLAPGHGFEDYDVCQRLGITVPAPVDGDGRFVQESGVPVPESLVGLPVLGEGSKAVAKLLGSHLLKTHKIRHKYPYDWRTKQPVIVRATAQWFADVGRIKDPALKALEAVRFVPKGGRTRLESFVKGRSEWCISRQRAWGVPIPVLYSGDDCLLTDESLEHIISVIQERGTDAWWSDDPDDAAWVPEPLRRDGRRYRRGADTMDVWFDSGSSWTQTDGPADVYLEGSDQHRGWFQSSLLTRVAAANDGAGPPAAPFRTLVTHGFALDAAGRKMSKSLGNIVSPAQVMDGSLLPPLKARGGAPPAYDALGPDALRLWAAGADYTRDVVVGVPVLRGVHAALTKYRVTAKMLLGSLHASARGAPPSQLDRIALLQLAGAAADVRRALDAHDFARALAALNRWLVADLSAFYLESLKDRLYCSHAPAGVVEPIFVALLRMLAPVTPLLVEEAWAHAPAWLRDAPGVPHPARAPPDAPLPGLPPADPEADLRLRAVVPALRAAHAAVRTALEAARGARALGPSLQCEVALEDAALLAALGPAELEEAFVVSRVRPAATTAPPAAAWVYEAGYELAGQALRVWVLPPEEHKCPRCWRYRAPAPEALCGRCEDVVTELEAGEGEVASVE